MGRPRQILLLGILLFARTAWGVNCNVYYDTDQYFLGCDASTHSLNNAVMANCQGAIAICTPVTYADCPGFPLNQYCPDFPDVYPSPPPPPPSATWTSSSTSTAASVSSAAQTANDTSYHAAAASDSKGQADSLHKSDEVVSLGANQAATTAAVFCADGANQAEADPDLSAKDMQSCREQFAAANAMLEMQKKMGKQPGFSPDPAVMKQEGTTAILGDFAKKFGVSEEDYMRRMLGAKGADGEFADMLKSKFSDDRVKDLLGSGEKADSSDKFAVNLAGKKSPPKSALRDSLAKKLASKDEREPAAARPTALKGIDAPPEFGHLEALRADEGLRELTIFDVVHRRYRELTPRMHL